MAQNLKSRRRLLHRAMTVISPLISAGVGPCFDVLLCSSRCISSYALSLFHTPLCVADCFVSRTPAGLEPPRPTRSKPLSAYPLTTRRPPVSSCGVEEAREVVERAREHAHTTATASSSSPLQKNGDDREGESGTVGGDDDDVFASGGGEEGGGDGGRGGRKGGGVGVGLGSVLVAEGIRSLIRATWEDVKDWCDEEAEARVRRKDAQVRVTHQFNSSFSCPPRHLVLPLSHAYRLTCIPGASTSLYAPL